MFTKDNKINTRIQFCFKMMSCKKRKFLCFFFILLTQCYEFPDPKLTNLHIFIIPLLLNLILFSKSPNLTAHIKTKYETGFIERFCEKNTEMYPGPSGQLRWSCFQPLTNFRKNPNI